MKLFLAEICLLLLTGYVVAQCPVSNRWTSINNKCMMCGDGTLSYAEARQACIAAGGNLGSIEDATEEDFAEACSPNIGITADPFNVWMGLVLRTNSSGTIFSWQDGSPETIGAPSGVTATPAPTAFTTNCFAIVAHATNPPAWIDQGGVNCMRFSSYVCSKVHVTCPGLNTPEGSTVTHSPTATSYYPGNIATYSCDNGIDGTGTNTTTRTCQDDGTWSGVEPTCNEMDCGTPVTPAHGAVSAPTTTYGSVATYSCNSHYDLEGSATRTCMATGIWSGEEPTCGNTLAIALGATFGGLALIGIIAGLIYCLSRAAPAAPGASAIPGAPYLRPTPYRRTPGYPRPRPPRGPIRPPVRAIPRRLY